MRERESKPVRKQSLRGLPMMVCGVLCLCLYVRVSVYAYVCMLGIKHEGVEEGINTNRREERGEGKS